MPKYLSLFHRPLGADPRPSRTVRLLRGLGDVSVCCLAPADPALLDGLDFHPYLPTRRTPAEKLLHGAQLLARRYEGFIWNRQMRQILKNLKDRPWDAICCHTLTLLPLAQAIAAQPQNKGRARLIFDAREFYARENEEDWRWRLLWQGFNQYLCRRYLPLADVVFTVSPGLAAGYKAQYHVDCRLLYSVSPWHDLSPRATAPDRIRLVHHGVASPGRQLELMIDAVRLAEERFSLDLMLVKEGEEYYDFLRQRAAGCPRIRFLEPVPLRDIVPTIAAYDVGCYLLAPASFNHVHALPNKLFEFIQARLAVVVGPSPDMAALVTEESVGIVAKDFSAAAFAAALNSLTPEQVDGFKARAHAAAAKFCWEENDKTLRAALYA